jgi:hypothetical protein
VKGKLLFEPLFHFADFFGKINHTPVISRPVAELVISISAKGANENYGRALSSGQLLKTGLSP